MADLHYTRDEVARLRDEATPGPWFQSFDGDILAGTKDEHVYITDPDDGFVVDAADFALCLSAPTLAADLLTLHAENADLHARVAALAEHADRMRAVLRALADACREADASDDAWDVVVALDEALVAVGLLDGDHRTWINTAAALRALAKVPRG